MFIHIINSIFEHITNKTIIPSSTLMPTIFLTNKFFKNEISEIINNYIKLRIID